MTLHEGKLKFSSKMPLCLSWFKICT
jgi:hypothetical protein